MLSFKDYLGEAKKTKVKDQTKIDLETPSSKGDLTSKKNDTAPAHTRRKSVNIKPNAAANDAMRNFNPHDLEGYEDEDIHPTHTRAAQPEPPKKPETLPAVPNKTVYDPNGPTHAPHGVKPNWLTIHDLPGYMSGAIRAAGRQLFKNYTDHPIENIELLSSHTHPEHHVQAVAAHVAKNGVKQAVDHVTMDKFIPGFKTDIAHFKTPEHGYLMMKDMTGHYVYRWPENNGTHISNSNSFKQLKENTDDGMNNILKARGFIKTNFNKSLNSTTYTHPDKGNIHLFSNKGQAWTHMHDHYGIIKTGRGAYELDHHLKQLKD